MPTLTRILGLLAVIAAIIYGAMYALAHFVEPSLHIIKHEIPASEINQRVIPPPPPEITDSPDNQNPDIQNGQSGGTNNQNTEE